jgi:hypothetical protein
MEVYAGDARASLSAVGFLLRNGRSMSALDIVLRFCLGGALVSIFSLFGELFAPKTFGGIFGAAPSVAVASLALAYAHHGSAYVAREAQTMMIGGIGLLAYATACSALVRSRHNVWLGATFALAVWGVVSGGLFAAISVASLSR